MEVVPRLAPPRKALDPPLLRRTCEHHWTTFEWIKKSRKFSHFWNYNQVRIDDKGTSCGAWHQASMELMRLCFRRSVSLQLNERHSLFCDVAFDLPLWFHNRVYEISDSCCCVF